MPDTSFARLDAWIADLAILVALVPLGTCMGVAGALLTFGALTGWVARPPLVALGLSLLALGASCLTAALASIRRRTPGSPRLRRGARLALFGSVVAGSWLLFVYALSRIR